jgi:hypothetical protein
MADPQIIANIKGELALNATKEKIISVLKVQGYTDEAIQEAFTEIEGAVAPTAASATIPQPVQAQPPQAPTVLNPQPVTPVQTPMAAAPAPAPVPAPVSAPLPPATAAPQQASSSGGKIVIVALLAIILAGGGVGFAYYKNLGPFAVKQYTEDTLLSGILEKAKTITTSSYKAGISLAVSPREEGAVPFVPKGTDPNLAENYTSDATLFSSVSSLASSLLYTYGPQNQYDYATRKYKMVEGKNFPDKLSSSDLGYRKIDAPYTYTKTQGGKNFAITVTLKTQAAIDAIKKSYGYSATSTPVDGLKVTLTKDSRYAYIPAQMSKPLVLQLADYLKYVSPEMSASVDFGATADMSKENTSDWKAAVSALGNMGDLSYAVDVEGRKKDDKYYVRINKMPSILSSINLYKGQWIVFESSTSTSAASSFSYAQSLSKAEASYKENRARFSESLRALALQADKDKLITFKNAPSKETVDGRSLYRYDLDINKEAVIPFYQHLLEESQKYKDLNFALSDSTLTYLKSDEFNELFDYIRTNTAVTLWTDMAGYPAILEYKLRVVPQDTAKQLAGKQVDVVFRLSLDDINKSVSIDTPKDAKTWAQLEEDIKKSRGY